MPGLAALLMPKYDRRIADNIVSMADCMCHEDFYKKEVLNDASLPFVAARVHLNITNREPQPIYSEDRTLLVMMDGELHTRNGLKERLRAAGHELRSNSDAELLLHLYEEMGEAFVDELNGWFVAIIHDIKRGKTTVVNDCFGLCRAFYAQHGDTLIIASEIKSILKYDGISCKANEEKLPDYFVYDGVLYDQTLFKDIYRLPAACIWTYRDGALTKREYFDFSVLSEKTSLSKEDFHEEVHRIFMEIMPEYAGAEGTGMSLTGGWDSRAELAAIGSLGISMPCYTWCGPHGESLDVRFARQAANRLGLDHEAFYLSKEFFDNFSDYAHKSVYVSDGATDIYRSHEIYFNTAVRPLAPVRLTGKFGSHTMSRGPLEGNLFRPYLVDRRIFSDEFLREAGDLENYVYDSKDGNKWIIDACRWLWPDGFMAIEKTQVVVTCPFMDKELAVLLLQAPDEYLAGRSVQKYVVEKGHPGLMDILSNRADYVRSGNLLRDTKLKILSLFYGVFNKADRAYLHHSVPDIFVRLDPFMRATRLEKVFLGSSLLVGYRRWVKCELRHFMEKMLLDEKTLSRPYLNGEFVKKMAAAHFGNRANYVREIGKIISLELWHRLFIDQSSDWLSTLGQVRTASRRGEGVVRRKDIVEISSRRRIRQEDDLRAPRQ
jgi:asparagine synthase (glutamine-hydrolysing)